MNLVNQKTTLFLFLVLFFQSGLGLEKTFEAEQDWILQQPVGHYTVQTFASTDESWARAFVARHDLKENVVLFRANNGPDTLYKGIYKSYDSRAKAEQGMEALRQQFPGYSFWIRRFGDIAKEIRIGGGMARGHKPVSERAPGEGERARNRQSFQAGQSAFNKQDYASALAVWMPLAEDGVAEAQYGLGFMYESGWGVVRDCAEAFRWYARAANQGHSKSQFNLGVLYSSGRGVARDRVLGSYWIKASARNEDPRALDYIANGMRHE